MPCVIQIKDDITSTIEEMSGNYTNKTPSFIKILQNTINNRFKVPVVTFLKQTDDTFLSKIHIPQSLIDEYYKNELLIEGERDAYEKEKKSLKKGVLELFDSNSELSKIGTPEQYSEYLDTIFPDSKVKDIVYHGSNSKIEKFDTSKSKVSDVIYFSNDIREAKYYATKIPNNGIFVVGDYQYTYLRFEDKNYYLKKEVKIGKETLSKQEAISKYAVSENEYEEAKSKLGNLNPSLINIKNLYQGFGEDLFFGGVDYFKEKGFDGFITNNDSGGATILAVFEPEQIHILGSKQDIEGFKEFVNNKNYNNKNTSDSIFNEYGVTHEEWNNASESEREMIIWQSKNNC